MWIYNKLQGIVLDFTPDKPTRKTLLRSFTGYLSTLIGRQLCKWETGCPARCQSCCHCWQFNLVHNPQSASESKTEPETVSQRCLLQLSKAFPLFRSPSTSLLSSSSAALHLFPLSFCHSPRRRRRRRRCRLRLRLSLPRVMRLTSNGRRRARARALCDCQKTRKEKNIKNKPKKLQSF